MSFTPIDRARIRSVSGCDERTIKNYPEVSDASRHRIERACAELDIVIFAPAEKRKRRASQRQRREPRR